jgi:uncharacterized 2Fe-2S/4Fe-4S cluster protein (DUF4445 family)
LSEEVIRMPLSLPAWMNRQPLVELRNCELPLPSLADNTGDWDRLVRALKQKGFNPIQIHPSRIQHVVEQIRRGGYCVTAVVGYRGCHWDLIEAHAEVEERPALGFAIDLGTSRLAFYLLDLQGNKLLAEQSVPNPQVPYGEDILTRILFARKPANRRLLQKLLRKTFNDTMHRMVRDLGYVDRDVYALAIAGNTTMSHLLIGLDPSPLCKEPYLPAVNRFPLLTGGDLGLTVHPQALVYLFPNVGSYFGGDLIADILAVGLHRTKDLTLLVDVGTNAEVVLGNRDWLIACAGAAGPALEGGVVERGMMAVPGAIDRVRIDPTTLEPSCHVIGGGKAAGICGSGLIDLIAEMFMSGLLTVQGKIDRKARSPRILDSPDGPAYVLVADSETSDGRELLITELDIGIFLKSKAAMYTILSVIVARVGLTFSDLKRFYVTGAFGNTIDPLMAIKIGMLPDLPLETYRGLADTVGCGAAMVLCDRTLLQEIERICNQTTYVELNVNVELMNEFRGALFLPHTDTRLFSSVVIPERTWP